MKFFVVTCIKESKNVVYKIFKEANIHAFSTTDIVGFKDLEQREPNLLEEWFASGDEQFDSQMIFSFTADENAQKGMDLIKNYNEANNTGFPVRAFILPVEKSSY